jgi:hypothetical protein
MFVQVVRDLTFQAVSWMERQFKQVVRELTLSVNSETENIIQDFGQLTFPAVSLRKREYNTGCQTADLLSYL